MPVRSSRNLGCPARERGHSRVPAPPAGMTAWKPEMVDPLEDMGVRLAISDAGSRMWSTSQEPLTSRRVADSFTTVMWSRDAVVRYR